MNTQPRLLGLQNITKEPKKAEIVFADSAQGIRPFRLYPIGSKARATEEIKFSGIFGAFTVEESHCYALPDNAFSIEGIREIYSRVEIPESDCQALLRGGEVGDEIKQKLAAGMERAKKLQRQWHPLPFTADQVRETYTANEKAFTETARKRGIR